MTKEQALAMLKAKRECIELDTKGNAELCDRNCGECKLNYEQGNMGEQKEALTLAIKALEQQIISCNATTEEIAQSFINDVESVKDYLPECNSMEFPTTFEEFANDYGFTDNKEIYTNGSHLIPVFRVKQWLDHIEQPTSDDCVSRQAVIDLINTDWKYEGLELSINELPPVTPTQRWIPLVWDEYPTVDSDGNDDYVYAVDYSVPMPKEDEWVLVTDENHNVVKVQYDGYDFGDYAREDILAWQPLPKPYEE